MSQECFTLKTEDTGVLAQLGERYNGIVEVRGSIPLGSTKESVSVNSLAKSFDTCSESYEISRPGYPNAVAELFKKNLGFKTSSKLLELAAGTGKFTDLLAQHDFAPMVTEWLPNMLKVLKSKHPKLSSIISRAEDIPFKDNIFDGVLVAQAFHWFANLSALFFNLACLLPSSVKSIGLSILNIANIPAVATTIVGIKGISTIPCDVLI